MSEKKVYPIAHSQVRSDTRDEVKALLTSYRNLHRLFHCGISQAILSKRLVDLGWRTMTWAID
jgi:hypothetical protein